MGQCAETNIVLDYKSDFAKVIYQDAMLEGLSGLIGIPTTKEHKELYNMIGNYIMETGALSNWGADPNEQIDAWAEFFKHRHFNVINAKTITIGPRRILSLKKTVKEVIQKREKIIKKGGVNWIEKALSPPSLIAMKVDRYGIVSKVIKKAKEITDDTRQSYAHWSNRIKDSNVKLTQNISRMLGSGEGQLNLNNASYDGIRGFYDTNGREVILIGETSTAYTVVYKTDLPEDGYVVRDLSKNIKKEYINATKEEINDSIIRKIKDEVINDILNGQLRDVKAMYVPSSSQNNKEYREFLQTKDGKALRKHIKDFQKARNEDRIYPYTHKYTDTETDTIYHYVMIKQGEQAHDMNENYAGEKYHAYVIGAEMAENADGEREWISGLNETRDGVGLRDSTGFMRTISEVKPIKDGWYKSNMHKSEGAFRIDKNGDAIPRSTYKEYTNFSPLSDDTESQAIHDNIMQSVWDTVLEYRTIHSEMFDRLSEFIEKNRVKSESLDFRIRQFYEGKISPITGEEYSTEELDAEVQRLNAIGGIRSNIFRGQDGSIHTIDSSLARKDENYAPIMWTDAELFKMIDNALVELHEKRAKLDPDDPKDEEMYNVLTADILYMRKMAYMTSGDPELSEDKWYEDYKDEIDTLEMRDSSAVSRLKEGGTTVHAKHRTLWTNPVSRRKDDGVYKAYFDRTFRSLHQNELVNSLKEAIVQNLETGEKLSPDTIEYMINRVKKSVGDVTVEAGIGKLKYGYTEMASWLNGLPKFIRRRRHWEPEDAQSLILRINGILTMRFLGMGGAFSNRTQIVNNIIHWGWGVWYEANKELKTNKLADWNEVIENTGVLNLLSMFNDIMLGQGEVGPTGFGFIPGTEGLLGVPIPSHNMANFIKLMRMGHDNFVENGDRDIDKWLMRLIYKEKEPQRAEAIESLRDYNIRRKYWMSNDVSLEDLTDKEIVELKKRREAYVDLFLAGEGEQTERILKARFKKLLGTVSETKLKSMITWKLTWWWEGAAGKELFTFTAGEQEMRKQTAVMALLQAKKMGLLPRSEDGSSEFMSSTAVQIARDAVYQSMFGMSPVYLGDAFDGAGRGLLQYKAYPLQQTIHDWEVWKAFNNGNRAIGHGDMVTRLIDAQWKALVRMGWKTFGFAKGEYNPKDKALDHEALAMTRLIYTRGFATIIATGMGLIPFLGSAIRMMGFSGGISALRSAENPMAAIAVRLFIWGILMGMDWDDDEIEETQDDWTSKVGMLLLPVIIGTLIRDPKNFIERYTDWLD